MDTFIIPHTKKQLIDPLPEKLDCICEANLDQVKRLVVLTNFQIVSFITIKLMSWHVCKKIPHL